MSRPSDQSRIQVMVGLGTNLGDRQANLETAVASILSHTSCHLIDTTAIYETEPWPLGSDQPWYFNAAVLIETTETIEAFHARCQTIETQLGRPETHPLNGPRIIDIDLLWAEQTNHSNSEPILRLTDALTLPHPRFHTRACTLVPLLERWADWKHPLLSQPLKRLHKKLNDPSQVRLTGWLKPPLVTQSS